jgi:hypothetical protein
VLGYLLFQPTHAVTARATIRRATDRIFDGITGFTYPIATLCTFTTIHGARGAVLVTATDLVTAQQLHGIHLDGINRHNLRNQLHRTILSHLVR